MINWIEISLMAYGMYRGVLLLYQVTISTADIRVFGTHFLVHRARRSGPVRDELGK